MGRGDEDATDACPPDMGCGSGEQPEHTATVSAFALDKYKVTVGRFRAFLTAYTAGWRPEPELGRHPQIEASGWQPEWDAELPATGAELEDWISCSGDYQTWQSAPGPVEQESYPMNCVNWYEAFAFCIWDGGRLPTEAEREKAAAGGDENRLYPWGSEAPYIDGEWSKVARSAFNVVGSYQGSSGEWNGRWGQADLAGCLEEWALDWYQQDYYADVDCVDCASLTPATRRVLRGGAWISDASSHRSASRYYSDPAYHGYSIGLRCARSAP